MFVSRTLTLPSQRVHPRLPRCGHERHQKASSSARSVNDPIACHSASSDVRRLSSVSECSGSGDSVIIVGAGIAGLCLAAALRRIKVPYYVLEQRGELSREGAAIGLWGNAFKALEQIGLSGEANDRPALAGVADTIRKEYAPILNVRICRETGQELKSMSFGGAAVDGFELIGVPRGRLQQLLYEAVDPGRVLLDATVTGVDASETAVRLVDGSKLKGRVVVGADGVRSAVAQGLGLPGPTVTGQMAFRGVAEFNGPLPIAASTVFQIWGQGARAGLYPMTDTSVYWFVTQNWPGALPEKSPEQIKEEVAGVVRGWQGGIAACVDATDAAIISRSRLGDRWLPPRLGEAPRFTLAGDALHPMTPNLGQGGCTALEDGIILAQQLKAAWPSGDAASVERALRAYEQARAARCVPLTVRSNLIGRVAQGGNPVISQARDAVVPVIVKPEMFFEHTLFDCGQL